MKIKKILAAVAAAAVAVSAMAVSAFALTTENYLKDNTVYINADKAGDPTWAIDAGVDQTTVYGVTYHVTFSASEVADPATWIGGGIGANSPSTGWKQIEWGRTDKEVVADLDNGTITWLSSSPVFKADDKYAQFWLQTWGGTVTVNSADVLGKDGVILSTDAPAPAADDAAPAADDTAADEKTDDKSTDVVDDSAVIDDAADADIVDTDEDEDDDDDDVAAADADNTDAADTTADTAAPAAPAADTTTAAAATGNVAVASIAAVMAVAGVAAIVSKKRK